MSPTSSEPRSHPALDTLPNEIIELITTLLTLPDILHLRLTSRTLASKSTQETLKSYYKTKALDLTPSALHTFLSATRDPKHLCHVLEKLTLVGVVCNTDELEDLVRTKKKWVTERTGTMFMSREHRLGEEEIGVLTRELGVLKERREELERWLGEGMAGEVLAKAFGNLRRNKRRVREGEGREEGGVVLQKLQLDVVVYREDARTRFAPVKGGDWKAIWKETARLVGVTLSALGESRMRVEELDVFSEVTRCAVARDEILGCLAGPEELELQEGLRAAFKNLKAFSISFSHGVLEKGSRRFTPFDLSRENLTSPRRQNSQQPDPDADDVANSESEEERDPTGLMDLLKLCGDNLRSLDLHQYSLQRDDLARRNLRDAEIFGSLAAGVQMKRLEGVRLRGLRVREADLRSFLAQSKALWQVVLQDIDVKEGSWKSILDDLTADRSCVGKADITLIVLDDLFEGGMLLYFDGEADDEPKCPTLDNCRGKNAFARKGVADVRREMKYHFAMERLMGSPQAYRWRENRRAVYGPP